MATMQRKSQKKRTFSVASVSVLILLLVVLYYNESKFDIEISSRWKSSEIEERPLTKAQHEKLMKQVRFHGIDPVYVDFFERVSSSKGKGFPPSRGDQGVVMVAGEKFAHVRRALINAERTKKSIREKDPKIRVALLTDQKYISYFNTCDPKTTSETITQDMAKACGLKHHIDDFIPLEDLNIPDTDPNTGRQATTKFMITLLVANTMAPYKKSLFIDTDAFPCPGFADIFLMSDPVMDDAGFWNGKIWTFPSTKTVDIAIGIDQYAYNNDHRYFPSPGDLEILTDFQYFADRNTGAYLLNFHSRRVHDFARFAVMVADHLYNKVATPEKVITNDQVPFKLALYLFGRMDPDFNEQTMPQHVHCRTYPGWERAGILGELNGMYPLQNDTGKICNKCSCTPCRINHCTALHFVELDD